jgi:hypothetical protein
MLGQMGLPELARYMALALEEFFGSDLEFTKDFHKISSQSLLPFASSEL